MKTNLTYSEEQYDAAIELLTRNPRKSIRQQATALSVDLPDRKLVYSRARKDPEFAARFAAAKKAIRSVISRHTPRAPKPVYRSNLLRRALLAHPLYRAANRAVPRGKDYSEDVVQEIVLTVLEGELSPDDIAARGNAFGFKRLRIPGGIMSLDEPTFVRNRESGRTMLVDTISYDNEIVYY
ncbi:hypothetical protein [Afipia felis]|nr:hypothetical protein [Afipia felis]